MYVSVCVASKLRQLKSVCLRLSDMRREYSNNADS